MFAMFKQLFTAITVFFIALEKNANAINHLSSWAEETAGAFADEARIERAKKLANLNADLVKIESTTKPKPKDVA